MEDILTPVEVVEFDEAKAELNVQENDFSTVETDGKGVDQHG